MTDRKNQIDHYEAWCQIWKERFLTLDQKKLKEKIPGLMEEKEYLTILYYGEKYGIEKKTGEIRSFNSKGAAPSVTTRLNIYTLLWYVKEGSSLSGKWVPFRDLEHARPFAPAFQKGTIEVFAATFDGHLEELCRACEILGGRKIPHSDAGYEIEAFSCIPIRFLFWDSDDEFAAQANILFDQSAASFIHVESTVTIASEGVAMLAEKAGLPLRRQRG